MTFDPKNYKFLTGYQGESKYRQALNHLVNKVFGISFEAWYQAGYWNEKYIPYTLFDGDKAVANISVNLMDFDFLGEKKRAIQIGTVLTDEAYRNQGLSRWLMEKVLKDWNEESDFIYLFANPSALEMYPKFGFNPVKEYAYFKSVDNSARCPEKIEKLNMDLQPHRDLLYDMAKQTQAFGQISMRENADLVMFYCMDFLKDNIFYIPLLDVVVVAKFNGNQIHIWDVFGKKEVDLDQIINSLISSETQEVLLGFTPKDCDSYQVKEISGDDTLFIQQGKTELFEQNKWMFPLLSHA